MTVQPGPLPRGRHHLSREEVAASQRDRILNAMVEVVAERGYVATSVAEITARAGVSRKSFYEQFTDKEDCYLVALDVATETIIGGMLASHHDGSGLAGFDLFAARIRAFLDSVPQNPKAARALLVEIYAVGPSAVRRRTETRRQLITFATEPLMEVIDLTEEESRFTADLLAAALSGWLTSLIAEDRIEEVAALADPFLDAVARFLRIPTAS